MNYAPRSVLVTGGAGFIGTNFVRQWLARRDVGRLIVLDALTYAGSARSLEELEGNPRFEFVHGDICDAPLVDELLRRHEVDTIVHFAAESHVDRSILGPDEFIRTNVVGTHALLKVARRCWLTQPIVPAHRFHHVSTDEVYGSLGPTGAHARVDRLAGSHRRPCPLVAADRLRSIGATAGQPERRICRACHKRCRR